MALSNICLVGANGRLGSVLLPALVDAGCFTISILKRASSTSPAPSASTVRQLTVPDDLPLAALTEAFAGQDAVIIAIPVKDVSQHLRLVEAAFRAGVQRVMPADFGSCDAASPNARRLLKLYRDKDMVRDKCEQLACHNDAAFSWTALVPGHFFEWSIPLHYNLDTQTAELIDQGDAPASTSTLRRVGEAVVAVLRDPAASRNRSLYVQSFCPTQRQVLAALEKATGTTWKREYRDSKAIIQGAQERAVAGELAAVEEIVLVLGALEADWRAKDGFAMDLLGLQDENLDDIVAGIVERHKTAK